MQLSEMHNRVGMVNKFRTNYPLISLFSNTLQQLLENTEIKVEQ